MGYNSISDVVPGNFYALAVQFEDVANAKAKIGVKDLLTCSNPKGRTSLHAWADQIHLWTGMAWKKYYFNSDISDWCKEGESTATPDTVNSGETVFFLRSSRGNAKGDSVTLSGGIAVATPSTSIEVVPGNFYFVSYPWPVEFPVADFKGCLNNVKGRTSLHAWADQVHRWTGMAWEKYYFNSTYNEFVKDGEDEKTTAKLRVGEGVFFLRSSRGNASGDTLTFTKPVGL